MRWIDIESDEAKSLKLYSSILKIISVGIESKLITIKTNGELYMRDVPITAEIGSEVIGLKQARLAAN